VKRPQLISKGALARLLQEAEEARNSLDFQRCVDALERAVRSDPANVNLLLNLAHAHGRNFNFPAAELLFERAFRISQKKSEVLAAAGMRARDFGSHVMAEHYYRLASEQKDATPDILIALAEMSEHGSRLAEASQLIDRALHLKPGFAPALLVQARLERQAGHLDEAEKLLRAFPTTVDRDS
jgi:Tfp pilus assembly protein PilF